MTAKSMPRRRLPGYLALAGLAAVVVWVAAFHLQVRDEVRAFVALQESKVRSGDQPIPIEEHMRSATGRAARAATAWSAAALAAFAAGVAGARVNRRRPAPPGASR
ncbi:MAG: hypothetical protein ACE148_00415 [Vicinamibacterales bacterium]